ncbi:MULTISPECIES: DUF4124 domain-containing protein [unclassified Luteimonas]
MRPAWAIAAGILGAGALAWWLAREQPPALASVEGGTPAGNEAARTAGPPPGPSLYRWRDAAGIVQITDIPPQGRDYTVVDVAALERRNIIDPDPSIEAAP